VTFNRQTVDVDGKFIVALAAGAVAAFVGARLLRNRHGIDFGGRVVVVTGGSRGLGLVIARQLAAQGAKLALLARDEHELDRAKRLLEEEHPGVEVMAVRCDVRRKADVRAAVAQILDRWTTVDVLINNAGVIQVGPLEHMQHEDFENAMATHFWGPLHLMMEIVPVMRRRGFGRIVNISSIGGRVAVPHLAPYCASKFALAGLSDAVRSELAPHGIRDGLAGPDADGLANQRAGQGAARGRIRVVCDCGFAARDDGIGGARRQPDPVGLRLWRS
jgi:NAD(P)-dependent dehydrogenase (short-subunit alcohol dehydrogenase family)